MVSSVTNNGSTPKTDTSSAIKSGLGSLGQADFLKLLTTQLTTQDPTDPVDNKEMVAQMAQFSQLAGVAEMSDTLKQISSKLDLVLGIGGGDQAPSETDDSTNQ